MYDNSKWDSPKGKTEHEVLFMYVYWNVTTKIGELLYRRSIYKILHTTPDKRMAPSKGPLLKEAKSFEIVKIVFEMHGC